MAEESWTSPVGSWAPQDAVCTGPSSSSLHLPFRHMEGGLTGSVLSAIPGTAGNEGLLLQGLAGGSSMETGEQGHQGALSLGALAACGWAAQEPGSQGSQGSRNEGGGRRGSHFTKTRRALGRGRRGCCATTTKRTKENEGQDEGRRCAENKALLLKAVFTGRTRPPRTKGSLG